MQQAKGDLLIPVIASLLVGALVSGGIVYAMTGMDKDGAPVAEATATPTATPSATASATPTATPTATTATTKDFTYNSKVLFSYPAEYTIIQQTSLPDGGGSALSINFGITNTSTGMVEMLPIYISQRLHGAPEVAPSLETVLTPGLQDQKQFTNSKGVKVLTGKEVGMNDFYEAVVTERLFGWKVTFYTSGYKATTGYSEAKLKTLFDQVVDTISF